MAEPSLEKVCRIPPSVSGCPAVVTKHHGLGAVPKGGVPSHSAGGPGARGRRCGFSQASPFAVQTPPSAWALTWPPRCGRTAGVSVSELPACKDTSQVRLEATLLASVYPNHIFKGPTSKRGHISMR